MKNVASYCLFGTYEGYWNYLPGLIRAHHAAFPDWTLRMYMDNAALALPCSDIVRSYAEHGLLEIVYPGEEHTEVCRSMLWRLKALWDPTVNYVLSRDVDSMPSFRERRCVDEFVNSGAIAHCINDCEGHSALMMGGMVGFSAPGFRLATRYQAWKELIALGEDLGDRTGGPDQRLLTAHVWPKVKHLACEHRLAGIDSQKGVMLSRRRVPSLDLPWANPELVSRLDSVCACALGTCVCCYIGAAGYNINRVVAIFDEFGPQDVVERIKRAEAA